MFTPVALLPVAVVPDGPAVPAIGIPNPFDFVGDRIVDAVRALLRALSDDFLKNLAAPVARYVLHTPDLLAEPGLQRMWAVSLTCLLTLAGLLLAIAGMASIPGGMSRFSLAARETLGVRFIACLLTAAVSLPVVALEVELSNLLVDALVPAAFGSPGNPLWTALTAAVHGDAGAGLAALVVGAVGVVLLVVLTLLGLARWAALWLLVILAPVAMGFATLPGGAGMSRLWWRLQLAAVFLPLAYAGLLGAWVGMFASDTTGFVGALSGVAVLALMAKLPVWAAGIAFGVSGDELIHRTYRVRRVARSAAAGTVGGAVGAVRGARKDKADGGDRSRTGDARGGRGGRTETADGGERRRTHVRHPDRQGSPSRRSPPAPADLRF